MDQSADDIKRHEYELGRWRKKVEDQKKKIGELESRIFEAESGAREMSQLVDSLLIGLAIQYGEAQADGSLQISVPRVEVKRNLRTYKVSVEGASEDGESLRVTVRRKKDSG